MNMVIGDGNIDDMSKMIVMLIKMRVRFCTNIPTKRRLRITRQNHAETKVEDLQHRRATPPGSDRV